MASAEYRFRKAIRLGPEAAEYHFNLAAVLDEQGQHDEARREYAEGLRLDPGWPLWADRLARDLLQTKNPKLRCPAEALLRARQACAATEGRYPEMLATLRAAEQAAGVSPPGSRLPRAGRPGNGSPGSPP